MCRERDGWNVEEEEEKEVRIGAVGGVFRVGRFADKG
jgi:hypothetical protein